MSMFILLGCVLCGIQFENPGNHSVARMHVPLQNKFNHFRFEKLYPGEKYHSQVWAHFGLFIKIIYLFIFVCAGPEDFSIAVVSGGYSLVVMRGFLTAVSSLVAEQEL